VRLRFLATAGPEPAILALDRGLATGGTQDLGLILERPGFRLWAVPGTPFLESRDGSAALVGLLFGRPGGTRLTALPVSDDLPERLLRGCWGAYAFFECRDAGHLVLRDPSGALPVYCATARGLTFYASDANLLARAWPEPFQPDLAFIRHWLTFPFLRSARAGISGVEELLPGTCRLADAAGVRIVESWSPFSFTGVDQAILDFPDAAARLRTELLRTVPRLAPPGEKILLQLSGGLDSSIVAAALANAGVRFGSVTFATRAQDGDERRFARAVAAAAGSDLIELAEETLLPSLELAPADPLRPPPSPLVQPLHRAIDLQAINAGAGILLDGAGGDAVFGFLNTVSPAIDALRRAGPGIAFATLRDIADVHGSTFWTAARLSLRRLCRGPAVRWPRDTRFLAPGVAWPEPDPHPWLARRRALLPGQADRLRMIVGIHHFLDQRSGGHAAFHPLLSQPVLELCFRIPSWLWVKGGRDRAVARAAFQGLLPEAILARRSKGRLESMVLSGYRAARPRIEAFLMDGRLRACGFLDENAVLAYLRQRGAPEDTGYMRLLEIAAAEQWLRSFDR
jgi:asparagine synthase (glutamine-hydrolysing)